MGKNRRSGARGKREASPAANSDRSESSGGEDSDPPSSSEEPESSSSSSSTEGVEAEAGADAEQFLRGLKSGSPLEQITPDNVADGDVTMGLNLLDLAEPLHGEGGGKGDGSWVPMKQGKWKELDQQMYYRKGPGAIHLARGDIQGVKASAAEVVEFLQDFESLRIIDPMLITKGKDVSPGMIHRFDKDHVFNCGRYKMPWGVSNREFAWLDGLHVAPDARREGSPVARIVVSRTVELVGELADLNPAVQSGFVRGRIYCSGYIMFERADDPNLCDIVYIVLVDVAGWLPAWVVNMSAPDQALNVTRLRAHFNDNKGASKKGKGSGGGGDQPLSKGQKKRAAKRRAKERAAAARHEEETAGAAAADEPKKGLSKGQKKRARAKRKKAEAAAAAADAKGAKSGSSGSASDSGSESDSDAAPVAKKGAKTKAKR
jgi:START domain